MYVIRLDQYLRAVTKDTVFESDQAPVILTRMFPTFPQSIHKADQTCSSTGLSTLYYSKLAHTFQQQ